MKYFIFAFLFLATPALAGEIFSLKTNLRIFTCKKENGYVTCTNIPGNNEVIDIRLEETGGGAMPHGQASFTTIADGHVFTGVIIVVKSKEDYMINAAVKRGTVWQGLGNVRVTDSSKLNAVSWYGNDFLDGKMVYSPVLTVEAPNAPASSSAEAR